MQVYYALNEFYLLDCKSLVVFYFVGYDDGYALNNSRLDHCYFEFFLLDSYTQTLGNDYYFPNFIALNSQMIFFFVIFGGVEYGGGSGGVCEFSFRVMCLDLEGDFFILFEVRDYQYSCTLYEFSIPYMSIELKKLWLRIACNSMETYDW